MGTPHPRRSDTRQRIQNVALDLFTEHGYEKTSLREIAEHLEVTKAALYYHFKTKEDIIHSIFEDFGKPLDELIAWAREQPRTLETKQELLRRYGAALEHAGPVFRCVQENEAAVRELRIGQTFRDRMVQLSELLREPDAALSDQIRCISAVFTMNAGLFAMQLIDGDPADKRAAVLEVAMDLVTQAHRAPTGNTG